MDIRTRSGDDVNFKPCGAFWFAHNFPFRNENCGWRRRRDGTGRSVARVCLRNRFPVLLLFRPFFLQFRSFIEKKTNHSNNNININNTNNTKVGHQKSVKSAQNNRAKLPGDHPNEPTHVICIP